MNFCVLVSIMMQEVVLKEYLDKCGLVVKGSGYWVWYLVGWLVLIMGYCLVNLNEVIWEYLLFFYCCIDELFELYWVKVELGNFVCEVVEFLDDVKVCWFELVVQIE